MSDQWTTSPGSGPPGGRSIPPGWPTGGLTTVHEPPTYGAGPPMPPLPPAPDRSKDRLLVLVASVLVVLVLLAVGTIVYLARPVDQVPVAAGPGVTSTATTAKGSASTTAPGRSGTTTARGRTSPTTAAGTPPAPSTTISPSLLPTQADIDAMAAELSRFVAAARGLEYKTPVKVEMVGDADFTDRLLKDLDKAAADIEKTGHVLKALGLVDGKVDLVATMRKLLGSGVLGFYDPETKQTVTHELVHALDDQWFDLNRPQYDDQKDEISFGFSAVAEGNARRIENIYVGRMNPAEKSQLDQEVADFTAARDVSDIPQILLKLAQAPYDFGPVFVKKLLERGGNATLAKALTDPPRMSASVMHSDRYFTNDTRVEVAKPQAEGKELDDGVFGELMTRATLEAVLAPVESAKAADGWGGDWYVTWEGQNKSSCIRIDYKMLTALDLSDLKNAYTKWGGGRQGVKVQQVGSDLLEVTSCSTGGAAGGRSPA